MSSILDQLRSMTVVVADTGDLSAIREFKPVDCTTNPSLVLKAAADPASSDLVTKEIEAGKAKGMTAEQISAALTVAIGAELVAIVPGRVSTEVDADLSFDTEASIARAREIVAEYARRGISTERILIKLAATWEGIRAAEQLEREGINCNLTLIFSKAQAMACADAGVFLISPFVGRITDWYKKAENRESYPPEEDPGVRSVRDIYHHYKSHGIKTVVMGASFRSAGQIKALAGCDRLTIAPSLLAELQDESGHLEQALSQSEAGSKTAQRLTEAQFRWELANDPMAHEKLAEGIRGFDKDHKALIEMIKARL